MEDGSIVDNTCESSCDTEKEDLVQPNLGKKEEGSKWAVFVESVFAVWDLRME